MEVDESVSYRLRRVYLSVFFSSIGLGSVYLIPASAEGLGAAYFDLGLIGTVRSFLPVIIGYLADRFDRRLLYLSSIFLTGAGTLVLALTNTISAIVLVQVFLGVGFALFSELVLPWALSLPVLSLN
jgi:MFS family permease